MPFGLSPIALLLMLAPLPATAPATQPASNIQMPPGWADRARAEADIAGIPRRHVNSIADVLRFSRAGDQIMVQPVIVDVPQTTRLDIDGQGGIITLSVTPLRPKASDTLRDFLYKQCDFYGDGDTGRETVTTVAMAGGHLQIVREAENSDAVTSVQFLCDPTPADSQPGPTQVKLFVSRKGQHDARDDFSIERVADTFQELRTKFPGDVDQYFRPILRDFGQESLVFSTDVRVAWQVLMDDWQPDPALAAKVNAIVAKLDVDDAHEREAARAQLAQLGQSAAVILLRMDRTKLSPEAQSSVDSVLANYVAITTEDAKKLRDDRAFLLEVLSADDAALRKLAWQRLQTITHTTEQYDPDADAKTRSAMITKVAAAIRQK